ncbi:hypothetical protein [Thermoflexibacter ruber]|uniref:Uncharacterized protein n=1 Tax=Thermoflexibacter ruber TaxID=1003 RepID=A0A1I2JWR9_9BACT|nr:hypothetical protein [Thermoflexibacter ruber]SFF57497.1 hypothetical protein SAMN04488541_10636 [Thermoflexibacter ruber]
MKISLFSIVSITCISFFYQCKSIQNEFTIIKQKKESNCDNSKDNLPCESYTLLKNKFLFNGYGTIIMDTTNEINRFRLKGEKFYIISINDIFKAEQILEQHQKQKYRKYYRQYFGMITSAKDTIVSITYLDFQNNKFAKKRFPYWEYVNYADIIPCIDCDYPNVIVYLVNISRKTFAIDK